VNWPAWIDGYPGLQKSLELVVRRMKAAYADEGKNPPKKNSDIVKEARYLQRKFKELEDRYYRLESSSLWRGLPQEVNDWLERTPEKLTALYEPMNNLQARLKKIETAHENRNSNAGMSIDEQFIVWIVRLCAAHDADLITKRTNAKNIEGLVDDVYINASIDQPDSAVGYLKKAKSNARKAMQK